MSVVFVLSIIGGCIGGTLLFMAFLAAWNAQIEPRLRLRHLEQALWRSVADDWELADLRRRYNRR